VEVWKQLTIPETRWDREASRIGNHDYALAHYRHLIAGLKYDSRAYVSLALHRIALEEANILEEIAAFTGNMIVNAMDINPRTQPYPWLEPSVQVSVVHSQYISPKATLYLRPHEIYLGLNGYLKPEMGNADRYVENAYGLKTTPESAWTLGFFGHTHQPSFSFVSLSDDDNNFVYHAGATYTTKEIDCPYSLAALHVEAYAYFDHRFGPNFTTPLSRSNRILINGGSVGQPRDGISGYRAHAVLLDTEAESLRFISIPYDGRTLLADMQQHRFPPYREQNKELLDALRKTHRAAHSNLRETPNLDFVDDINMLWENELAPGLVNMHQHPPLPEQEHAKYTYTFEGFFPR